MDQRDNWLRMRLCQKKDATIVTMAAPNLFMDDLTLCSQTELQQAIVGLVQSGVEEKFRLDFKEKWEPDKQCPDIVAFANSYGGLLVLGVTDDRLGFPGLQPPSKSDLKTQLASVIATRISPVPLFEIHTCPSPTNAMYSLAVIRVSPQPRIHMYLRGDKPVYIRNEDQSVPARAVDLQALLDRVRSSETRVQGGAGLSGDIARDFFVTRANNLAAPLTERKDRKNRQKSTTVCRISAIPERSTRVELDPPLEQRFVRTIHETYPSISRRLSGDQGSQIFESQNRAGSWYSHRYLDVERDHEIVWAFDKNGLVQFICECAVGVEGGPAKLWSLADFLINLDGGVRLVHHMWTILGYFGDGQFLVELSVPNLVVHAEATEYPCLFYSINWGISRGTVRTLSGEYPVAGGRGEAVLSYDARSSQRPRNVANLGNQVLRDLRFGVDVSALADSLEHLPRP